MVKYLHQARLTGPGQRTVGAVLADRSPEADAPEFDAAAARSAVAPPAPKAF
jgi:hypothetical protein